MSIGRSIIFAVSLISSLILGVRPGMSLSLVSPAAAADGDLELCNHSLSDPDAGIPACTRLIDAAKDATNTPGFYNNRGVAKVRKGDLDSAIKDFSSALDRNPGSVDAFKNRGLARQLGGDYDVPSPTIIRRSGSTESRRTFSMRGGRRCSTRKNMIGRSPITTRRLRSTQDLRRPITIAARRASSRSSSTARSPTSINSSGSRPPRLKVTFSAAMRASPRPTRRGPSTIMMRRSALTAPMARLIATAARRADLRAISTRRSPIRTKRSNSTPPPRPMSIAG